MVKRLAVGRLHPSRVSLSSLGKGGNMVGQLTIGGIMPKKKIMVKCSDCHNIITRIASKGDGTSYSRHYYCVAKERWMPQRKLDSKHKCPKFLSLKEMVLAGDKVVSAGNAEYGEPNPLKTPLMMSIEREHGRPLEKLLMDGNLSVVSEMLRVDESTVSKWRKKLGLERS